MESRLLLIVLMLVSSVALAEEITSQISPAEEDLIVDAPVKIAKKTYLWSLVDDLDGIKTYRKEIAGSAVFPLKGETILNAPILKVLSLMLDDGMAPEWIDLLAEIELIRTYSEKRYTLLYKMDSPFPLLVSKRDFLLESNFRYQQDENSVTLSLHSVQDEAVPPHNGYIRGHIYKSEWVFTAIEENKTMVTLEYHVDPKGLAPKWMVRRFQKSWPYKTLKALDHQLQSHEVQIDPDLYKLSPGLVQH